KFSKLIKVEVCFLKLIAWQENKVDDIVRLWNQELGNDFPMRRALFLQNSFHDINVYYEGSQLAVDNDGRVIGFSSAKKSQDSLDGNMANKTGRTRALVVGKEYQGQQIGSKLLRHAETALKNQGMDQVLLGRETQHYFTGIPRPN